VAQADDVGAMLMAAAGDAVKALTLEVAANLIAAAPVDTGHARRNFVPSIGAAHDGEDDGGAQAAGQAELLSYKIGDGDTYVTNNVDYLQYLVLGSSTQAPAGWDLIAIDQAVATIQAQYDGIQLDVTSSSDVSARGAGAAAGVASAYSPFGGDE
jgi:hypothetical protein